jgi:hypothetical protein
MNFLVQMALGAVRMLVQPLLIAFGAIQAYRARAAERRLQEVGERNEIEAEYRHLDGDDLDERVRKSMGRE